MRLAGRAYEALAAGWQRRAARDLYHSALQVQVEGATFVVEQTPVPDLDGEERGVVAGGAVGIAGRADLGSSATRSAAGATDAFPTSPRRWTVLGG